ncbi:2-phospho-L-lactate guanylyltransferase [Nocardioides jishulii]|uniref:Phosphoenolpyruvate guanylyltransferase n=1 Tax=Nocardioides jishulii TaxID=2575440 RepID=A0A4U2YK01_9ACTN|nr:2-phospho-L-lactate guanylyltransferase [Nocardioides jishulii]QCX27024.1 2-phospho-L-lactate guanylyltransferase [Nocardioides jishulii]TKI61506.1 2-phospho-L-lactate guanylyltransferase [Nocardioides jishulii]
MSAQDFVVLVPVKRLAVAKSRLSGLGDEQRRALAEAFVLDTVTAALAASRVRAVLVVTDDHRLASTLAGVGCAVVPDGVSDDLNQTLRLAAAEAVRQWPGTRPAALCADLPALTPQVLDAALEQARSAQVAMVADTAGSGTTLFTAAYEEFWPRFGPGSRAAHLAAGAVEVAAAAPLRQDVDSPADLGRALLLGTGPHTARATGRG